MVVSYRLSTILLSLVFIVYSWTTVRCSYNILLFYYRKPLYEIFCEYLIFWSFEDTNNSFYLQTTVRFKTQEFLWRQSILSSDKEVVQWAVSCMEGYLWYEEWYGTKNSIACGKRQYNFLVGKGNTTFWYGNWTSLGPLYKHLPKRSRPNRQTWLN